MKTFEDLKTEILDSCDETTALAALEDGEYLSNFDVCEEDVTDLYNAIEMVGSYMNTDLKETVSASSFGEFLKKYSDLDPEFTHLLSHEFPVLLDCVEV